MTTAKTIANIILESGNTNELTLYTTAVNRTHNKLLQIITQPQSTANYSSGPNESQILDLLRIEKRLTIDGFIELADQTKLISLFEAGGVFTLLWDGTTYDVNSNQLTILDTNLDEENHKQVKMTVILGTNIGTADD